MHFLRNIIARGTAKLSIRVPRATELPFRCIRQRRWCRVRARNIALAPRAESASTELALADGLLRGNQFDGGSSRSYFRIWHIASVNAVQRYVRSWKQSG